MSGLFIGLPQFDIDYHRNGESINWTFVGDEHFTVIAHNETRPATAYGQKFHCAGVHVVIGEPVQVQLSDGLQIDLTWKEQGE